MMASEVTPFAKTGGLADVVGALPHELQRRGHDVRIMMPLFRTVDRYRHRLLPLLRRIEVQWGTEVLAGEIMRCAFPGNAHLPVYFIDQNLLFGRSCYYGENNQDYTDNDRRFGFFCLASLWTLKALDWSPDIIHLHDWQAGLAAPLLRHHPVIANDTFYQRIRSVFTIHNLAYQGLMHRETLPRLQLGWKLFTHEGLEFHGLVSALKAGIVYSDQVTTVSPTYAREIQEEEHGAGLDGVLRARSAHLHGILNGIDTNVWNPQTDPHLPAHFSADDLAGKAACRKALLERFFLKDANGAPIIAVVSRLVEQKGFDLLERAASRVLSTGARLVVLGTGDPRYEEFLRALAKDHPGQVGALIAYDEALAHVIEAGADLFLMPSRYEPSGLNQLYSMRYGTLPVVRRVGGLADSVEDATPEAVRNGTATGFVFDDYTPEALAEAIERAVTLFTREKESWRKIQRQAMARDSSWQRSAMEYERVYEMALGR